jgi:hypothetical protein
LLKDCTYYFRTRKTKKYIYKKSKRNLAPKRAYNRSHPDPEPAIATDNPEQLLRKRTIVEGSISHSPLQRSPYFPEELVALQDLDFDILFEQSLFRTKSDSFVAETVLDPTILQP